MDTRDHRYKGADPLGACRRSSVAGCWCHGWELSEALKEKLQWELQADHVEVKDTFPNHCSTSFKVTVVSPMFQGKPLLQRHMYMNSCPVDELKIIHTFDQKTDTGSVGAGKAEVRPEHLLTAITILSDVPFPILLWTVVFSRRMLAVS
ncbi:unnamed protein product [Staurois parvus]|uniref:BolA family transcriptional regulator n=1 Tax=Staurois parvus TaxID=386267 RepID=A0ABN9FP85_9NEOB|nr:unnamed protein product [Staurois parvus]